LALLLVRERKQTDQIAILHRAGFQPMEIAKLLGTTPNSVSVQLSAQKRGKKVGKRRSVKR
jgi:predicted transcriptional regulator